LAVAGCGGPAAGEPEAGPRPEPPAASSDTVLIPPGAGHLAAMAPEDGLTLRDKPDGKVIAHLKPKTAWGSPTVVWAPHQRGRWLGVVATALANNQIGWLDVRHDRPRMWRQRLTLRADLSERTVELRRGPEVLRTVSVTIGAPGSPTPTGRFTVTDKLIPGPRHAHYGCCLLALSGHQPKLRPGWAGGDRIAIHGSLANQVGAAASAGCLRASDVDLKRLMKAVPVGTPVVIRD
jgi:hypothetical protein